MARFHVIAAVLAAVLVVAFAEEVYDVRPDAIHAFIGNEKIEICGCGFTKYNSVVCIFNGQWMSTNSWIVDDNTVICQAPAFPKEYFFDNLPQDFSVHVVYDNDDNSAVYVGNIRVGPQLNIEGEQVSPQFSRRAGGGTLTISGSLFADNWDSPPTVYFDDVAVNVSTTGYTDTTISVAIPAGKLNQNARISLRFYAGGYTFYLAVDDTLRYGPFITGITETCVDPYGGTTLTVTGQNLDDTASGNDGTRPLIIVSYEQDKNVPFSSANPNFNFQISLLGSTPSATQFTFDAPDVVQAITDASGSPSNDYVSAWGLYVSVDVYFDQSWARSTAETGEPLYILDEPYLIDQIGDLEPQTIGFRYGGYVIHSSGLTIQGTKASTPSASSSYAHYGGEDPICIQFCGVDFVDFDSTNGAEWTFYYDNVDICDTSITRNGDTFCCNTDVFSGDVCDDNVQFSASLKLPTSSTEGSGEIFDLEDPELSNVWADEEYTAGQWQLTVGPVQISNQFNIIGVSATASVQYSVYAANYARTTSTEWSTRDVLYDDADGQSLTPSGTTEFTHTDTTVSVTYPSYFFDVTNLVSFQFDNKVCVENYVHWGPLCGPWYLQKDSGKDYISEEFDNFDIDNLGLSSRYVGLNSGSVSISSEYGQSNTGFSTQVVLCERGSFPDTTANENPFLWDTPASRFDDNNGGSNSPDSCTVFQVSASGANSAQLPTNNNQFLWGEQYDVFMYFNLDNDNSGTDQVSANYNSNFASEISIGATTYTARTRCGRIRVGCTADGASCSSPYGPSQGFYELNADGSSPDAAVAGPVGTIGSVEVTGLFMDNPSAPEVALVGYSSSKTLNGGSAGLTAGTQWNKETLEHADSNVNVVCDICNVTDPATTFRIRYGPEILYMDIEEDSQGQGDEDELTYDLWGASCVTDYNSYLTIYGYRFSDYIVGQDGMYENSNSDLSASYPASQLYITVFVDGVQANIDELVVPQTVDEVQALGVYLPTRPFGTAAVVKVYFGKQHYHAEELRYDYASNWNHYLVADQKVHYTPLILDAQVTAADDSTTTIWGYAASAHGLDTITVTGLGFFEPYNTNVFCYLDDYVVKGAVTADDTVECYFKFAVNAKKRMDIIPNAGEYQVPDDYFFKYGAEFNTNVTFHLEIQDGEVEDLQYLPTTSYGYILDGNDNDNSDGLSWSYGEVTNELGVHDIKISGDQLPLFHWGPVCNSLTDSVQSWTTESDIDSASVDLGGFYLQDCLSELTPDNTDYRTPWTLGDDDVVDTYCQARNVSIYMVWDDNSGATRTYTLRSQQDSLQPETWQFDNGELTPENIAANSVLNNGNTGTTISNIPCNFEGWFYIYYHDAHATNNFQRNIYCSEPYEILQPTWDVTADTGTGPTGYGLADDLDELPWLFGWIGNEIVTTFSYNVQNSEYLGAASCIFSHDSTPVTPTVNNNEVSCALPSGNWQETGTLTIRFEGSDDTELDRCDHLVAKYTYGPGVLDEEHCNDPFDIDCSEADIQFRAYGPTCCDLATSSHVIFGAGYNPGVDTWSPTWSTSNYQDAQTLTVPIPGASGFTDCDSASTGLTARQSVPLSSLGPIGIAFYGNIADKTTLSSMNDCTANSNVVDCLFTTVDGSGFNQVCFGPSGNSFVREVRYTYGLQNDEVTYVDTDTDTNNKDIDHADVFTAAFAGVTNTWEGYDAVFVDFCKGSTCDDRLTDDASLGLSSISVNLGEAMYADASPAGSKQFMVKCGDPYNSVRFRVQLDSNSSPKTVLEDFAVFTSVTGSSPTFLAQTGDEYRVTLDHSPKIKTAVHSCDYDQTGTTNNPLACTNLDSTTGFRASEYGLLMIDVTLSNLYDFYQPTETDFSTYNFGKFGVIGFLGSEDGSNIVSRASVGSLNEDDEEYIEYTAEDFAQEVYEDFVLLADDIGGVATTSNGQVTLRFVVPPGEFNSELFFHAHYNPHIDAFTSTDGDQFLWVPYVTAVSKTWVIPRGHENLAYQGHGFTGSEQQEEDVHHTVLQVSNSFRTGVDLQASCRIYTDNYITCLTPAFSTPSTTQSADIQFTRCYDDVCDNAWFIPSNQPIDIVGTVAIAPQTISNDGGTVVYFPFYGMSHFDTEQIFCGFPDLQSVDHEWLFPVVLNTSNVAFNKPVYECFIPDILGLTVDNATDITTLNLYFKEPNVPKCDDVDQPFLVTLSTHPVQVGFPCAREADFTPAADNDDANTYSGFGVVVVPNLRNKNGVVSVRGDFFPEVNGTTGEASPVDFRCRFEYYNWRAYYDPENSDNGDHYHYRNVLSDLASGPHTYTLVVNGDVEVYAEQWDCTLPESNGDDRDFDVIVVTAVYRGLEDDNCHVVLLNSAAAFASSLVVLLVALAALF